MNHYLICYRPPRDSFPDDATDEETRAVESHFEYLKKLNAEGSLILAGRTEDAALGLFVFSAPDNQVAEEIFRNDPAVQAGVFSGEVKPFRLALLAG